MTLIRLYKVKSTLLEIVIYKTIGGCYQAYEVRTRENGGNILVRSSFCLGWLIETIANEYGELQPLV